MSSRKSIQQVISSTEPVGGSLGDEWLEPTTGVLRKLTLVNGIPTYLEILTRSSSLLTGTQTFTGTASTFGTVLLNTAETFNIFNIAPPSTTNYYLRDGSVQYYTANATNGFVVNLAFSAATTMNSALAVGQSTTCTLITTQSATAYFASSIQVDGTTSGITTRWVGGAPTAGNASGFDVYRFAIIKTAASTYTVLASLSQYK